MVYHNINIVLDAQGFLNEWNQFIFKEVAYIIFTNAGVITSLFHTKVGSPIPFRNVHCVKTRCTADWLLKHHHSLSWDEEGVPYKTMVSVLSSFDNDTTTIYLKGANKLQWFKRIFKKAVLKNLESEGCVSLRKLRECNPLSDIALQNVWALFKWIQDRRKYSTLV